MELKFIIDEDNIIIKDYLKLLGYSRNFLRKVRVNNCVYVNGELAKNYFTLHKGDELVIKLNEELNEEFVPNTMELDVLYEDNYLLIVNKPVGLASQPSRKHFVDNLISVVTNYYQKKNIKANIHLVNRLDYATSGIVVIAKAGLIHHQLSQGDFTKKYLCLVEGKFAEKEGTIDLPIRRVVDNDIRRWVFPDGKPSLTTYKVIKEFDNCSLLEVEIKTGRTHQIRVHMAYINHPLVGDVLYGHGGEFLYLHCYHLEFIHPIIKEKMNIINYPIWYEEVKNA